MVHIFWHKLEKIIENIELSTLSSGKKSKNATF